MPQSTAMLANMGAGYVPLAQGSEHSRRMPFEGLPLIGGQGGLFGQVASMAAAPPLMHMMGGVGMVPMGVGHDQNVYDRLMNQRYTAMQMQAMQKAAESDREGFYKSFRGLAAVTGTPFGAQQRAAANQLAHLGTMAAPMMAEMMPDFLDQMGGLRGSATVMSKRMMDAGRYRLDPVTGRMGMSGESVGRQAQQLFGDLYSPDQAHRMQGVSAGQAGALFHELQMRGMVGTAASESRFAGVRGDDPRAQTLRALEQMRGFAPNDLKKAASDAKVDISKGLGNLSPEDIDKLNLNPTVADKLRSFDGDRIKRSLRSYVGAVSAMRDIFGDMGRPNAPMQELLAGLEALTGGAMAQIDPARLGTMARQTYNLAKQTGVSLDNALMVQQHAQSKAQSMGLEPIFGVQAAQGALGFGGAYRAQGHAAHTAWGAFNADQAQQMDANLRVQASGSHLANRMGAAIRMSEMAGGFAVDSDAAKYVQAVKGGLNQWKDASGQMRSVAISDAEFTRIFSSSKGQDGRATGLSQGDAFAALGQRHENREQIERHRLGDIARRAQGDELNNFVGHRMQETMFTRLREHLVNQGMSAQEASVAARSAASAVGQSVTRRAMGMSTSEFADAATRNRNIAEIMEEELTGQGMGDVLQSMDPAQRQRFLAQTAERFYGSANRAIQTSSFRAFGNLQNVHRLNNTATLDEADRQQMQARHRAEMQEALAPLGQGTILSRAVDALQHARPDDPQALQKVLAQAMGGVRNEDINRALIPQMRKVQEQKERVEKLQEDVAKESDSEQKQKLMEQLNTARRELSAQAKGLAQLGEQHGMYATDSLGSEDMRRVDRTTRDVMTAQNDIVGLRGNFGGQVDEKDIAAARAKYGGKAVSATEAAAVILARRQQDVDKAKNYALSEERLAGLEAQGAAADPASLAEAKKQRDELKKALGGELAGLLTGLMGQVKAQATGMNDMQARAAAVGLMQANVGNIGEAAVKKEMGGLTLRDDGEVRALIRTQRRMTPYRASQEEVQKYLGEHKDMTEREARDILNMRLRAKRLGIREDEVDFEKIKNPEELERKLSDAFAARARKNFEVTDKDREEFRKANPALKDPTGEQITQFMENNPEYAGKPDEAKKAMLDRVIRMGRQSEHRQRMAAFWGSAEGGAFRETVDMAGQDVDNVASRLIQTPHMVQRLGTRAIEYQEKLSGGQQRLRELALYHTSGDMGRLMAGDYNIDRSNKGGQESAERVAAEVTQIQRDQRRIIEELREQEGRSGRQFRLGSEDEARKALGLPAYNLSPEMRSRVRERAGELGTEENARTLLGIDKNATNLSEFQKAKIAGARFGAGNEEEVIGTYGRERWEQLSPGERQAMMQKMRTGVASKEEAMKLLGITDDQLKNDPTGEYAQRLQAVMVGLQTDAHGRQLAGIDQNAQLTDKGKDAVRAMRQGIASEDWARSRMGLAADNLSPEQRAKVLEFREKAGNEEEARRLLKLGDKKAMTDEQGKNVTRIIEGAKTQGEAMRVLGLSGSYANLKDADKLRVDAAQRGLGSKEHAAKMLGLADKLSAGTLSKDDEERIAAAQKRLGTSANAMIVMGLDPAQTMTKEESDRLRQATYDVSVARRLKPEDDTAIGKLEQSENRLKRIAESRGLKVEDLEKAATGDKKFELSKEEGERLEKAKREHGTASRAHSQLTARAANLRRSIATLGDDVSDDAKNKRRQALRDSLASTEKEIQDAEGRKKAAETSVEADAKARGVSVQDYLRNKGFVSESAREEAKRAVKERDENKKAVDELAKSLGVKPEDLAGATGVTKRLEEAQKEAARRENMNPQDVAKGVLEAYGFTPGAEPSATQKELGALMGSTRGKALGQRMLDTSKTLSDRAGKVHPGAKGTEGVDTMAQQYFDVMGTKDEKAKAEKLKKFQETYGFDSSHGRLTGQGAEDWRKFEQAMQFQQQTGLLKFGRDRSSHRSLNREEDLLNIYRQAMQGGQAEQRQLDPNSGQPQQMQISFNNPVRIDLQGRTMDMPGATGGGRNYVPPGGT